MSSRTRFLASGLSLAALLTLGTAAGSADAAPAAAPRTTPTWPLVLSLVKQAPNQRLTPGGSVGVAIMKVSNTTGKAEQFTDNMSFWPTGWLQLNARDVAVRLTPQAGTPATPTTVNTWGPVVHIPAHTTFTWKVSLAATRAWPLNDTGFSFEVGVLSQNPFVITKQLVSFPVGSAKTGGPINESLTGGTKVAPGRPAEETLTLTNRTGARIDQALDIQPQFFAPAQVTLALDEWVGSAARGHWQAVQHLTVPRGLANGATDMFRLRVRVTRYTASTSTSWTYLSLSSPDLRILASQRLTVDRTA